ncbi:DUF6079 family protein, partial [Mesonia sp.]
KNILYQLQEKGEGKVLNREDLIEFVANSENLWLSKDFKIEAELEFVVLAALAALGELEITLSSGQTINSTNLFELKNLAKEDVYTFTHVKPPKGLNLAALKAMFMGLLGRDLSKRLNDPSTYTHLVGAAEEWAKKAVATTSLIQGGLLFKGVEIISPQEAKAYSNDFTVFARFCDKLANYNTEAKMKNFQFSVEEVQRILETKPVLEKVQTQLEEVKAFDTDITYLQQAKQYVTNPEFKNDITQAINQLAKVLSADDKKSMAEYQTKLEKLKEDYADWYLQQYLKYRISEADDTQKQALLDSEEKTICEILQEADFLSSQTYLNWLATVNKLQLADDNVNKGLILTTPYHDFNPVDYEGNAIASVKECKTNLHELLSQWEEILKNTLEDPMVKKNRSLLEPEQNNLLKSFESGETQLKKDNALAIRNAIMSLQKGLTKIELSWDDMKVAFTKPLTPEAASEVFKDYIDQLARGKEREKIRIILK